MGIQIFMVGVQPLRTSWSSTWLMWLVLWKENNQHMEAASRNTFWGLHCARTLPDLSMFLLLRAVEYCHIAIDVIHSIYDKIPILLFPPTTRAWFCFNWVVILAVLIIMPTLTTEWQIYPHLHRMPIILTFLRWSYSSIWAGKVKWTITKRAYALQEKVLRRFRYHRSVSAC